MASDAGADDSVKAPSAPTMATATIDSGKKKTSKLVTLPEELLCNIAAKLDSDDIFSLRLTCRDLEAKSLHEFATEYFSSKCFMFTTQDLKVLVNVAKSEKLSHYLQEVGFSTGSATQRQLKCYDHGSCHWRPTVRQHEAFIHYMKDQKKLRKEGDDKKMLVEAFSHLPRLQRLFLADYEKASPTVSHGPTKFKRKTGIAPSYVPLDETNSSEYYPWLTHLFRTMMLAVVDSDISTPTLTHLSTQLSRSFLQGLSPIDDLEFKPATLERLGKVFSNLTNLDLCLRSRALRAGQRDDHDDLKGMARALKRFASVLRNVSSLSLSLDATEWSGPVFKALTSNMDLRKITNFYLDSAYVSMKALASTVCKLESAQMITFTLVEIKNGSWVPILQALQKLPNLSHLHMQYVQADGQKCFFLEQPNPDDEDLDEPSWFDPLTGDTTGGDEVDWSDQDDGSDESLPDLIEQDGSTAIAIPAADGVGDAVEPRIDSADKKASTENTCPHRTKKHRKPGMKSGECGYYICLQGEEIQDQIPQFIKDYNLGGDVYGDDLGGLLGGLGGIAGGFAGGPGIAGGAGIAGGTFTIPIPVPPPPGAQAPPPPPGQGQAPQAAPANAPLNGVPPGLGTYLASLFGMPAPPAGAANQGQGQAQGNGQVGNAAPAAATQAATGATPATSTASATNAGPAPAAGTVPFGHPSWNAGTGTQAQAQAQTQEQGDDEGWMDDGDVDHGALDDVD